ncbi:MAG TPA: hypothetical protein VEU06_12255 [Micropepsaceae bacterium]|jgi:anti-sigma-K factor RskA|nr:hypothetical protein [Micropepsaceae bacterium]
MPSEIVRRESAPLGHGWTSVTTRETAAANDNVPTHALWRKIVAAAIGAVFAIALVLVGLVCTGHAAELGEHSVQSSGQF